MDWVGFEQALATGSETALYRMLPTTTTYALSVHWLAEQRQSNVSQGLSPSGVPMDGTAIIKGPFSVIAFRDESTGRVNEVYTPLAGGAPVKREFVIGQDGSIGTFTTDGKLQFLMKADHGQLALAELQPDNNMVVSSFAASGVVQEKLFKADADTADGLRSGRMDLKQPLQEIYEALDKAYGGNPDTLTDPVGYETVIYNGNTYTVSPRGTLDRAVPGHSDWTESRDSTGGGVIMDDQGNTLAQLLPGDRVGRMDDGRIVVNDIDGRVVNRVVDETAGEGFYTPAPPIVQPPSDPHVPADTAGTGTGADGDTDTATDAGGGGSPNPAPESANPYSYTNYLGGAGANLSPTQQAGLAAQLDALNLGGEGALSFITLPGGATLIQNADGEIVGEINQVAIGSQSYTRVHGVRINADGSAEPYTSYVAPGGQALSPAQYEQALYSQATTAIGLMNSIIGLQNWDSMGDLQRVAAIASMYNAVDKLAGGSLPGELGGVVSVLGLLNALDQGNIGGIAVSGIAVVDFFAQDMASNAIGAALGIQAGHVVPGIGLLIALDSGDPLSVASAALAFIPGWGQAAAIFLSIAGGMFADDDIPMKEGQAHAQWDSAGNIQVITDQDVEGGGATAAGWMNSIANGLQAQLAGTKDAAGNSYALIPNLLPAIGYQYDADGFNYGVQGHLK